ncbi:dATP/dGTP diphosphohydrolase domain-containing protein [Bradyrhizobium sp. WCU1]
MRNLAADANDRGRRDFATYTDRDGATTTRPVRRGDVIAEGAAAIRELKERADGVVPAPSRKRLIDADSATRKRYPMASGLLDYFPDALAEVAGVSWAGNEKHNPGEAMHHARGKSMDHPDCIMRHLTERGGFDVIEIAGVPHRVRHSAALAWRALALLQEEIEAEFNLPLPRGARAADQVVDGKGK